MFKPSICSRLLPYTPPYDWETTLEFFRTHQLPYIESVDDSAYERVIRVRHGLGWFRVEKKSSEHALLLSVSRKMSLRSPSQFGECSIWTQIPKGFSNP